MQYYSEEENIGHLIAPVLREPLKGMIIEKVVVNTSGSTDNSEKRILEISALNPEVHLTAKGREEGICA